MEILSSTLALSLLAVAFGVTMKLADLLDEHGLKWFKGSDLIFGLLWGITGGMLLLFGGVVIANILLAMVLAFLVRNRLDYINHQVAALIIVVSFLFYSILHPTVFLIFLLTFIVFGSLKDCMDTGFVNLKGSFLGHLNEAMLYYPVPTLIYGLVSNDYLPFIVFTVYAIFYNLTKIVAAKKGYT